MLNINTLLNNIAKVKKWLENTESNNEKKITAYNRKWQIINNKMSMKNPKFKQLTTINFGSEGGGGGSWTVSGLFIYLIFAFLTLFLCFFFVWSFVVFLFYFFVLLFVSVLLLYFCWCFSPFIKVSLFCLILGSLCNAL